MDVGAVEKFVVDAVPIDDALFSFDFAYGGGGQDVPLT